MGSVKKYSFFAAHLIVEEDENGGKCVIKGQTIEEHCKNVSIIARRFADPFGAGDAAALCGLAHDIGKYSKAFQKRIWEDGPKVDHSAAGAIELKKMGSFGFLCVAGHHAGLSNIHQLISERLTKKVQPYEEYKDDIVLGSASDPSFVGKRDVQYPGFVLSFYIRMLFSCLVDADYLDTELFMSQGNIFRANGSGISELCGRMENYIKSNSWLEGRDGINFYRSGILKRCINYGKESSPGIFTLTVPTGGGKTCASLAFALNHAKKNGMKRVIYVVPYCAIIDQTVDVYNKILGEENVLAHYSEAEFTDSESGKDPNQAELKKLAAENWDMPVVVTTAVQFFESLFSNKTSKCRKIHNIADSVIVFDEAQTIPVDFIKPCVFAITELALHYHSSCILCTATQPSLEMFINEYKKGTIVREISENTDDLYRLFKRVNYEDLGKCSEDEIALHLSDYNRVLCIVSTRSRARSLYEKLPNEGRYHLSTRMTPEHRKRTLDTIRERLIDDKSVRVVSTSLIEAGVDLDFPVVYRELAGLDSMIQAGGRCNREGREDPGASKVFVFRFKELKRLPSSMKLPAEVAETIIMKNIEIDSPKTIKEYFDALYYHKSEGLDREKIVEKLNNRPSDFRFADVGEKFKLIDTFENKTIFIPRDLKSNALADEIRKHGEVLTRSIYRQTGKYSVSVSERVLRALSPALEMINEEFAILAVSKYYSQETGLAEDFEGGDAVFG